MIYLEIPFVAENNRVSRTSAIDEIRTLKISEATKAQVFDAIYHRLPRGVTFDDRELEQVLLLENALRRLGIPFRQVKD